MRTQAPIKTTNEEPNVPPKYSINAIVQINNNDLIIVGRIIALRHYGDTTRNINWEYKLDQINTWWAEEAVERQLWQGLKVDY